MYGSQPLGPTYVIIWGKNCFTAICSDWPFNLSFFSEFILKMNMLFLRMSAHFNCFIADNHLADYTDRLWWATIIGYETKLNVYSGRTCD